MNGKSREGNSLLEPFLVSVRIALGDLRTRCGDGDDVPKPRNALIVYDLGISEDDIPSELTHARQSGVENQEALFVDIELNAGLAMRSGLLQLGGANIEREHRLAKHVQVAIAAFVEPNRLCHILADMVVNHHLFVSQRAHRARGGELHGRISFLCCQNENHKRSLAALYIC